MRSRNIPVPPALTLASLEALEDALEQALSDGEARVWILQGGAGVFCRGMDLGAAFSGQHDIAAALRRFSACLSRIRRAPRPTLAVVAGEALGGGVGIAAACDQVVASPDAAFGLPEALFGLLPGAVLPVLVERMTVQKARLLALSGVTRDARWARASGLVDDIVPGSDLPRERDRLARELARVWPRSVRALRGWLCELSGLAPDAALARGAGITADLARDEAVGRAARAFLEEGCPPWRHPAAPGSPEERHP